MSVVKDAANDKYFGRNKTMTEMIKDKYFDKENAGKFWNLEQLQHKDKGGEALTKDLMQAICMLHTYERPEAYCKFSMSGLSHRPHKIRHYGTSCIS